MRLSREKKLFFFDISELYMFSHEASEDLKSKD